MAQAFSFRCLLAASLPLLLLAGCATAPTTQPGVWQERDAQLLAQSSWDLRGRIGYEYAGDGGQARLQWEQLNDTSLIRLSGPFGAGAYTLTWEPARVTVADAGGERSMEYLGPDAAEQFLEEQLGWLFPAGSLRFWLRGLADPAAPREASFADSGVLQELTQLGWEITYDRYSDSSGILLPRRIEVANAQVKLRIAVSNWHLSATVD